MSLAPGYTEKLATSNSSESDYLNPKSHPVSERSTEIQSVEPKFRDPFWFALFYIHIGVNIFLLYWGITNTDEKSSGSFSVHINKKLVEKVFLAILIGIAATFFYAAAFVNIMKKHALGLVKGAFFFSTAIFFIMGILFLKINIVVSILFFISGLINILYYWCFRERFEFAAMLVERNHLFLTL